MYSPQMKTVHRYKKTITTIAITVQNNRNFNHQHTEKYAITFSHQGHYFQS